MCSITNHYLFLLLLGNDIETLHKSIYLQTSQFLICTFLVRSIFLYSTQKKIDYPSEMFALPEEKMSE